MISQIHFADTQYGFDWGAVKVIRGFGVNKAQEFVQEYHDWISIRKPIIRENAWHTLGSFQRK